MTAARFHDNSGRFQVFIRCVGLIGTLLLGVDGFRRTTLVSISAFSLLQAQECFSNGF